MPSGYMPQKIYRFRSLFSVRSILISLIKNLIICGTSLTFLFRVNTVRIKIVDMSATLLFGILWLLAVTAIVTVLERWYRNRTLQKPVRRILDATEEVTKGNLKAAIEPIHKDSEQQNEFDLIIRNFNLMLKELQGMETLKTGFISNVSHEMKTPLSSISNYAVLMQMPGIGEEKRIAYAKQVAESTRRLSSMITNILKLNKLENQTIFPMQETVDLSEQIVQSILGFESVWEDKNIEIDADIPDGVIYRCDQGLLEIVWNNLISNAVKFTPEGGRIRIQLTQTDSALKVLVQDNGIGMDKETQQHIFEKFYQGDTSHSTHGNGLGLALVARILDIVYGSIEVQSAPGKGSTFIVSLPLRSQAS